MALGAAAAAPLARDGWRGFLRGASLSLSQSPSTSSPRLRFACAFRGRVCTCGEAGASGSAAASGADDEEAAGRRDVLAEGIPFWSRTAFALRADMPGRSADSFTAPSCASWAVGGG